VGGAGGGGGVEGGAGAGAGGGGGGGGGGGREPPFSDLPIDSQQPQREGLFSKERENPRKYTNALCLKRATHASEGEPGAPSLLYIRDPKSLGSRCKKNEFVLLRL